MRCTSLIRAALACAAGFWVPTEASAQAAAHWMQDGCYYAPTNQGWVKQKCQFRQGGYLYERYMNGYQTTYVAHLNKWMDASELTQYVNLLNRIIWLNREIASHQGKHDKATEDALSALTTIGPQIRNMPPDPRPAGF